MRLLQLRLMRLLSRPAGCAAGGAQNMRGKRCTQRTSIRCSAAGDMLETREETSWDGMDDPAGLVVRTVFRREGSPAALL